MSYGRQMEVIGQDVMGNDVMGYAGPMDDSGTGVEVVGHDEDGYPIVVGRSGRARRANRPQVQLQRPPWRGSQLAPGVVAPDEGLVPLPLGNFTFSVANGQVFTFSGQMQKPFRGERLLVTVQRTGTSAVGRLLGQIFVGTDLSQADVQQLELESIGNPLAFGVRLTMKPAQPGVFIRIPVTLSSAITSTDTIFASISLLGRIVH